MVYAGFLDLPREIRDKIYLLVLRPDCIGHGVYADECEELHHHPTNFIGTTKLFRLCRAVHAESIELVHMDEVIFAIESRGVPLFRHPRAFGLPGFWKRAWGISTPTPSVPQRFSELQFIRLRKIALTIDLPQMNFDEDPQDLGDGQEANLVMSETQETFGGLKLKLRDAAKALRKVTHLQSLRIFLKHRDTGSLPQAAVAKFDHQLGIPKLILNVIKAAWDSVDDRCRIQLGMLSRYRYDETQDTEYLLGFLLESAMEQGVGVKRMPDPSPGWNDKVVARLDTLEQTVVDSDTVYPIPEGAHDELTGRYFIRDHPLLPAGNHEHAQVSTKYREKPFHGLTQPYEIIPECRKCYAIFPSDDDLKTHLRKNPTHMVDFRKKTLNNLVPYAKHGKPRVCKVCGRGWLRYPDQSAHEGNVGHGRRSVIPMYRADNDWWEKKCREAEIKCDMGMVSGRVA